MGKKKDDSGYNYRFENFLAGNNIRYIKEPPTQQQSSIYYVQYKPIAIQPPSQDFANAMNTVYRAAYEYNQSNMVKQFGSHQYINNSTEIIGNEEHFVNPD